MEFVVGVITVRVFLENGQFTSTLASVTMLRLCMFMVCFVTEAVRTNPTTSKATNDQVEKEIKEWLKFAAYGDGDRSCDLLQIGQRTILL